MSCRPPQRLHLRSHIRPVTRSLTVPSPLSRQACFGGAGPRTARTWLLPLSSASVPPEPAPTVQWPWPPPGTAAGLDDQYVPYEAVGPNTGSIAAAMPLGL